jgi:hypothetical protein
MDLQKAAEDYVSKILADAAKFASVVKDEVDRISIDVALHAVGTLSSRKGLVAKTFSNSAKVLNIANDFDRSLQAFNYRSLVLNYTLGFSTYVEDFRELYGEMASSFALPRMLLTVDDQEILSNQAAAAIAAFNDPPTQVHSALSRFLVTSLGDVTVEYLVNSVSDIIRKRLNVQQIAKDQSMVFIRALSSRVYRNTELLGKELTYRYSGALDGGHRKFCAALLSEESYTKEQIDSMANEQTSSVFDNCGGYGCCHIWRISGVVHGN